VFVFTVYFLQLLPHYWQIKFGNLTNLTASNTGRILADQKASKPLFNYNY